MKRLNGETALITGATGLIGTAIAKRFAEEGARVIICSRSLEKAKAWIHEHGKAETYLPAQLDLSNEKQIKQLFDEWEEKGWLPSLLIANASQREGLSTPLAEISEENFTELFGVDVAGHFLCARTMIERKPISDRASILFLSSVYAEAGVDPGLYTSEMKPTPVQYAAVKAGTLGLTRYLAALWGSRGIRVNAIVSGGVRSNERQSTQFADRYSKKTMLGRMALPEEIANAALFLASHEASYITGHSLAVDGGLLAW